MAQPFIVRASLGTQVSEPVHLESCDFVHFDHDDGDRDIDDSNDV